MSMLLRKYVFVNTDAQTYGCPNSCLLVGQDVTFAWKIHLVDKEKGRYYRPFSRHILTQIIDFLTPKWVH